MGGCEGSIFFFIIRKIGLKKEKNKVDMLRDVEIRDRGECC